MIRNSIGQKQSPHGYYDNYRYQNQQSGNNHAHNGRSNQDHASNNTMARTRQNGHVVSNINSFSYANAYQRGRFASYPLQPSNQAGGNYMTSNVSHLTFGQGQQLRDNVQSLFVPFRHN